MGHFDNPSFGVKSEGFFCVKFKIRGEQGVPVAVPAFTVEEQTDLDAGELRGDGCCIITDCAAVLYAPGLLENPDKLGRCPASMLCLIPGPAHLYHSDKVASEVP